MYNGSLGFQNLPTFRFRPWSALDYSNRIACFKRVFLVVSSVFLRFPNSFLKNWVLKPPFNRYSNRLVIFIGSNHTLKNSFWHSSPPYSLDWDFSFNIVNTLAASRFALLMREVFSSCPVACWNRRLKDSFFKEASSSRSWSGVFSRSSPAFIAIYLSNTRRPQLGNL